MDGAERDRREQDSTLIFAPRNNTTRDISKTSPPADMETKELIFARQAALALGVPPCILMQVCHSLATRSIALPLPHSSCGAVD